MAFLRTQYTKRVGIRLRFNTVNSTVHHCRVTHTGTDGSGNGEGIYLGTARVRHGLCGMQMQWSWMKSCDVAGSVGPTLWERHGKFHLGCRFPKP